MVAVDLPADVPGLGARDYAAAVESAVESAAEPSDRLVLVGHSLGGLTVPVVAQRLGAGRVAAIVLVAAMLPVPGRSLDATMREEPDVMVPGFGRGQERHEDRTTSWPAGAATEGLYSGVAVESSAELVAEAVGRMRRQAWTVSKEVTPLTEWPAVPTVAVVCADDRVVDPAGFRRRAAAIPGASTVELPGGHFPMLTRPAELATALDTVVMQVAGRD